MLLHFAHCIHNSDIIILLYLPQYEKKRVGVSLPEGCVVLRNRRFYQEKTVCIFKDQWAVWGYTKNILGPEMD